VQVSRRLLCLALEEYSYGSTILSLRKRVRQANKRRVESTATRGVTREAAEPHGRWYPRASATCALATVDP
jgi:hypothetical protein